MSGADQTSRDSFPVESDGTDFELSELRLQIARIDRALQRAIERRLRVARSIGCYKKGVGLPIRNRPVEAQVHQRWQQALGTLGVTSERSSVLADWLIDESVRAQRSVPSPEPPVPRIVPRIGAQLRRARSPPSRRRRPTRILKFGGSIAGDPARVARAVDLIARCARRGNVIAVASAPGTLTDDILGLLPSIPSSGASSASLRTLARGEELGARVLDTHLRARGIVSRLVVPEDAGWPLVLRGGPWNAEVDLARSRPRVRALLTPGDASVIVLPGFVGVDRQGGPALLPRGGSDVTAVALGRLLRAEEVALVKDVPGLLFADPDLCSGGPVVREIDADDLERLAEGGCPLVSREALRLIPPGLRVRVIGIDIPVGRRGGTRIRRSGPSDPAVLRRARSRLTVPAAGRARVVAILREGPRGPRPAWDGLLGELGRSTRDGRSLRFDVPLERLSATVEKLRATRLFVAVAVNRASSRVRPLPVRDSPYRPTGGGARSPGYSALGEGPALIAGADRSQTVRSAIDRDLQGV